MAVLNGLPELGAAGKPIPSYRPRTGCSCEREVGMRCSRRGLSAGAHDRPARPLQPGDNRQGASNSNGRAATTVALYDLNKKPHSSRDVRAGCVPVGEVLPAPTRPAAPNARPAVNGFGRPIISLPMRMENDWTPCYPDSAFLSKPVPCCVGRQGPRLLPLVEAKLNRRKVAASKVKVPSL
jgi:hypothetical protein